MPSVDDLPDSFSVFRDASGAQGAPRTVIPAAPSGLPLISSDTTPISNQSGFSGVWYSGRRTLKVEQLERGQTGEPRLKSGHVLVGQFVA